MGNQFNGNRHAHFVSSVLPDVSLLVKEGIRIALGLCWIKIVSQ